MARRPRNFHDLGSYVQRHLAAADPFYRGEAESPSPGVDRDIRPVDPRKTAHDLGRLEPGASHIPPPVPNPRGRAGRAD